LIDLNACHITRKKYDVLNKKREFLKILEQS